jgi:hypothetical protein
VSEPIPSWLTLLALLVELGALGVILVLWWSERKLLAGFLAEMSQAGPSRERTGRGAGPIGEAAAVLEKALKGTRALDEAFADAIGILGRAPFHEKLTLVVASEVALIFAALSPMIAALTRAATDVQELGETTRGLDWVRVYVHGLGAIEGAFAGVRQGFLLSAMLVAGLIVLWAARWWLLRPEARESRALATFVRCAAISHESLTPATKRVYSQLTPQRTLWPGLWASLGFMLCSAGAVAALTASAELRLKNDAGLSVATWPNRYVRAEGLVQVAAPSFPAGSPLAAGPSLIISDEGVYLGSTRVLPLVEGQLPATWRTDIVPVRPLLASFRTQGDPTLLVLAHRTTPLITAIELLRHVRDQLGGVTAGLVLKRRPPFLKNGERPVQAMLPLEIATPGVVRSSAAKLSIDPTQVKLHASTGRDETFRLQDAGWKTALRDVVRDRTGVADVAGSKPLNLRVEVEVRGNLSYDRFVEVLAATDSVCMQDADCGLPGLGLQYFIAL